MKHFLTFFFILSICLPFEAASAPRSVNPDFNKMEAFLDGVIQTRMKEDNQAGAVLSIVHNGETIIQKGYGFTDVESGIETDPEQHLFRIGSITKLFTWIALMQQVEQGNLSLDTDVNEYLEAFKIPETYEQPVTLRSLMSHTPGFEDILLHLFVREDKEMGSTEDILKEQFPRRVRPPLQTAAYSNHGTALAQYIIELASGMPIEEYAEKCIFTPMGMYSTTLKQPLPETLQARLSKAYTWQDGRFAEKPFEVIPLSGMGAASITAADMALFMKALLNNTCLDNYCLIDSTSYAQMKEPVVIHSTHTNPALMGFMDMSRRNVTAYGHGGNTFLFHSTMALLPEYNMGFFVSFNSEGGSFCPEQVFHAFLDEFFPDTRPLSETIELDESYMQGFCGTYKVNRHSYSDFFKLLALTNTSSISLEEGKLRMDQMNGKTTWWLPVDSLAFREESSNDMIAFKRPPGEKAQELYPGNYGIMAFERLHFPWTPSLHLSILIITLFSMVYILLVWPWVYFVRRRYEAISRKTAAIPFGIKLSAWIPAFLLLLFILFTAQGSSAGQELIFEIPGSLKLALFFPIAAVPFILFMTWQCIRLWQLQNVRILSKLFYTIATLAFLATIWQLHFWNLLGWRY